MTKKTTGLLFIIGIISCLVATTVVQGTELSEGVQTEGVISFYQETLSSETAAEKSATSKVPIKNTGLPQTDEKGSRRLSFVGTALLLLVGVLSYSKIDCLRVEK